MNENSIKTRQLAQILAREEKKFLMEQYASLLVQQLEGNGQEELGERTIESLVVARSYASPELADQIATLLSAKGVDVEWEDEEVGLSDEMPLMGEESTVPPVAGQKRAANVNGDDETLFEEDGDEAETLFEEDEDEGAASSADDEIGLFEQDEDEESLRTVLEKERSSDASNPSDDRDKRSEEDPALPEDQENEEGLFDPDIEEDEEDEEAGVLFSEDIYTGNKGTGKPSESSEEDEKDSEENGESTQSQQAAKQQKKKKKKKSPSTPQRTKRKGKPGFEAKKGHEQEETPGFEAKKGRAREETPGFEATQGHQQEETPGFEPKKGHEAKETPGFEPKKGHEAKETPGFKPSEGSKQDDTAETRRKKARAKAKQEKPSQKRKRYRTSVQADEEPEDKKASREQRAQSSRQEALERAAKAKEELEKRRKAREAERLARGQESEGPDEETGDLLEAITYSVSLDDLERYLDIKVSSEDRLKLERRMHTKMREPSVKALLNQMENAGMSYAMIPRLPHFFKSGSQMKVTIANLLRNYPHLFGNVQEFIPQFRTQPFFIQETPPLDWALVTSEVLPDSLKKSYAQQKMALKQYAHQFQANELRVRRRNLVDALYDLIVVQLVLKENLLKETVDLTESKIGRQDLAVINYGENGIRIGHKSRQDTHPQLGVCPCW